MRLQSNELNFEGQNIYVGIDVHLKSWTVTTLTKSLHHKTFSQASNVDALMSYLCNHFHGENYIETTWWFTCWIAYGLDKEFGRIQRNSTDLKDVIFAFLYDEDLPYDNNGSERLIRKAKIKMKVSQCFRYDGGTEAFSILHSIMDTAKKNGQSAFAALRTIADIKQ
jgi:hypothetical protein